MRAAKPSYWEVIENSGPNNMREQLRSLLKGSSQADIAVTFISAQGLSTILEALRQVANRGRVRVITGLYQGITEPSALRILLRVQDQTKNRLSVHLSTDPKFHRKVYIATRGSRVTTIVGSTNLTQDGLTSGGELNVVISGASASARRLCQLFQEDWRNSSRQLKLQQIRRYEKHRPASAKRERSLPLHKILGAETTRDDAAPDPSPAVRCWQDYVDCGLPNATERLVEEQTSWDEKGYNWFAAGRHPYRVGDVLLFFDFLNRDVSLVRIKGITRTSKPTKNGRHFVAYKPIQGFAWRRMTANWWRTMKSKRLLRNLSDARSRRLVSPGKWHRIEDLFRKR
jgi:HKD family nuclease